MEKSTLIKAKKALEKAKNIALFCHPKPDGDCIGAMLGLAKLLEKQGKKTVCISQHKPSKTFSFLKGINKIKTHFDYKPYDLILFMDFSGYNRITEFTKGHEDYFDNASIIIFDHHIGDEPNHVDILIKDIDAMSTCEIVFEVTYPRWKNLFDQQIATFFYLGLSTDSGNFRYDDDSERILTNALALVKLGADKKTVTQNVFRNKSLNSIKFMSKLFDRIVLQKDILYTYYTEEEHKALGIDEIEANYALNTIQDIKGAKVVVLFKKFENMLRGSIRAKNFGHKGHIDCNKLARLLGGGGHKNAAGFALEAKGDLKTQIKDIIKIIEKNI